MIPPRSSFVINRSSPLAAAIDLSSHLASRFCPTQGSTNVRGPTKHASGKASLMYTECCPLYAKSTAFYPASRSDKILLVSERIIHADLPLPHLINVLFKDRKPGEPTVRKSDCPAWESSSYGFAVRIARVFAEERQRGCCMAGREAGPDVNRARPAGSRGNLPKGLTTERSVARGSLRTGRRAVRGG